ncbi:MAG: 50S ribosomal protein L25 [Deltaproteobacteria bacterium]|nr:50S ribosomal protein L25 [Candidatus Anaeroferrophillacea bacterium]
MAIVNLAVQPREFAGKSAVRDLRRNGMIPAVVYGKEHDATMLTLNEREFTRFLQRYGQSSLVSLQDDGVATDAQRLVIIKDVQHNPVSGKVIHVDFHAVRLGVPIQVEVPVNLVGKPVGIARGGLLQPVRRTLEIRCLPRQIPETIDIDVSGLDIGEAIHVEELHVEGVEFIFSTNFTIVTVQGMKAEATSVGEEGAEAGQRAAEAGGE